MTIHGVTGEGRKKKKDGLKGNFLLNSNLKIVFIKMHVALSIHSINRMATVRTVWPFIIVQELKFQIRSIGDQFVFDEEFRGYFCIFSL